MNMSRKHRKIRHIKRDAFIFCTYEIRNTMKCLDLMCKDLNDAHNNYDVSTDEENAIRYELLDSIELFNDSQTTWKCTLNKNSKGWCLRYE